MNEDDAYEAERQARITANQQLLLNLGLNELKDEIRQSVPATASSSKSEPRVQRPPKQKRTEPTLPSRKSARLSAGSSSGSGSKGSAHRPQLANGNDSTFIDDDDDDTVKLKSQTGVRHSALKTVKYERAPETLPVSTSKAPLPTRATMPKGLGGRAPLVFEKGYTHFKPNLTPAEMLQGGMMGGGPFRLHKSALSGHGTLKSTDIAEFPKEWHVDVPNNRLFNCEYDVTRNRFGVKAGQSLSDWEQQGWLHNDDPRGWWQWYFRFYQGRRHEDDARQISRWMKSVGAAGRFKRMLALKIASSGASWDDESISPVVRQTLWHWAYELNQQDYNAYVR